MVIDFEEQAEKCNNYKCLCVDAGATKNCLLCLNIGSESCNGEALEDFVVSKREEN